MKTYNFTTEQLNKMGSKLSGAIQFAYSYSYNKEHAACDTNIDGISIHIECKFDREYDDDRYYNNCYIDSNSTIINGGDYILTKEQKREIEHWAN